MTDPNRPLTLLAIATYVKGFDFLDEARRQGARVLLLTLERLRDEWPRHLVDDLFFLPGDQDEWKREDLVKGVSFLARTEAIDRIVALDDFDVEKAALLREHLRVPGMSESRTRFFRDKLAMRMQAQAAGIPVPPFAHVLNVDALRAFTETVPPPWVVKPRSQAAAFGIKKVHDADGLWRVVDELGDEQSFYLVERFVPGDIYHADSVVFDGDVVFARAHRYGQPPLQVTQEGGIFLSATVAYGSEEETALLEMNRRVLRAMGHERGASHTEFIRAHEDGAFYFLETSARVGGANIAEMLEASSGVNLWREWAKIECLRPGQTYHLPEPRRDYSGIIVSLARQEHPDTSAYADPEIAWRMQKPWHAGLVVRSESLDRVRHLLDDYARRFQHDFHASLPPPAKLTA